MPEPAWLDPVEGDDIDDIVNWQLAGGGQRRGIYGNYDVGPARCPNPAHADALWHGQPAPIYGRGGYRQGECPGSVQFRDNNPPRNT